MHLFDLSAAVHLRRRVPVIAHPFVSMRGVSRGGIALPRESVGKIGDLEERAFPSCGSILHFAVLHFFVGALWICNVRRWLAFHSCIPTLDVSTAYDTDSVS